MENVIHENGLISNHQKEKQKKFESAANIDFTNTDAELETIDNNQFFVLSVSLVGLAVFLYFLLNIFSS